MNEIPYLEELLESEERYLKHLSDRIVSENNSERYHKQVEIVEEIKDKIKQLLWDAD